LKKKASFGALPSPGERQKKRRKAKNQSCFVTTTASTQGRNGRLNEWNRKERKNGVGIDCGVNPIEKPEEGGMGVREAAKKRKREREKLPFEHHSSPSKGGKEHRV